MGLFGFFKKKQIQEESFKEQRMLPRWAISAKAKIKYDSSDEYIDCHVRNLNMRGFSVIMTQKIPPDCNHFTLYFNENFFFTVDIVILWHKETEGKYTYGIKFSRIRDSDREKMYKMMRQDFAEHIEKYK